MTKTGVSLKLNVPVRDELSPATVTPAQEANVRAPGPEIAADRFKGDARPSAVTTEVASARTMDVRASTSAMSASVMAAPPAGTVTTPPSPFQLKFPSAKSAVTIENAATAAHALNTVIAFMFSSLLFS